MFITNQILQQSVQHCASYSQFCSKAFISSTLYKFTVRLLVWWYGRGEQSKMADFSAKALVSGLAGLSRVWGSGQDLFSFPALLPLLHFLPTSSVSLISFRCRGNKQYMSIIPISGHRGRTLCLQKVECNRPIKNNRFVFMWKENNIWTLCASKCRKKKQERNLYFGSQSGWSYKKSSQRIFFFMQSEERLFLRPELFTKAPLNVWKSV